MLQDVGNTKSINGLKKSSRELHGIKVHWSLLNKDIYATSSFVFLTLQVTRNSYSLPRDEYHFMLVLLHSFMMLSCPVIARTECQTKHVFDLPQSRQTFILISVKREMIEL